MKNHLSNPNSVCITDLCTPKKVYRKNIFFLALTLFSFGLNSQTNVAQKAIMEDSLWKAVSKFCNVAEHFFNKENVKRADADSFLTYVRTHTGDSVQTAYMISPFMATQEKTIEILQEQTKDMIGKKCTYEFTGWDGWDGTSNYAMFQFKISHDDYDDQFLVIVRASDDLISCIFSADSKF